MLAEANAVLREQQGRDAVVAEHASPRAARLGELEVKPPRWLRSAKQDVAGSWVLWAECDGHEDAHAARSYAPAPSIVVASGSGPNVHAYWPLRQPLAPRDAEVANLRLAYALGADRVCFDAARILRPPGTWNHKHAPPHPVKALRMEREIAFDAADVIARAPAIEIERIERRWSDQGERDLRGDPLLRIPPPVYVSELLGVPARSGRKVHCPFHDEQHPSLHVYPTAARGWSCFSCGRGGSIYDLAAGVWRMRTRGREFLELRQLLHERFADRLAELDRGLER